MMLKKPSPLPGFGMCLGFTVLYLSLVVLVPLSGLFVSASNLSWDAFVSATTEPRVLSAYRVSFGISFAAAAANVLLGVIVAWVLTRYRFPGRSVLDAFVDLPFALPTAVAGIALAALYAPNGWIGKHLEPEIHVAFTPLGIFIALLFVGLPFVVRTVEPVLKDLSAEVEEAAASLGASRLQVFAYVIFPSIFPALLTGFAMAFARGLGEFGSVIFIAGNVPGFSEIVPLLIMVKLEEYDIPGATALALVMLLMSFVLLLLINALQRRVECRK